MRTSVVPFFGGAHKPNKRSMYNNIVLESLNNSPQKAQLAAANSELEVHQKTTRVKEVLL